ncbi:MAG: transporter substrate-binding domain-containing protein [Bryobacteraceae bacterium]|jgi:hypothetical protein
MPKNQSFKDLLKAELSRTPHGVRTVADLVRAARVPASAVSMVISGQRSLRSDVAERLGHVMCDDIGERSRLIERLVRDGRKPIWSGGTPKVRSRPDHRPSVVDRMRRGEGINVGVIVCEPFVNADGRSGFAIDLFHRLASLMGIQIARWERLQLKELERRLGVIHEFDVIVSNLLPTFRRRTFMAFSRPLPYLGVPLSGIVSVALEEKFKAARLAFDVEHLLTSPSSEPTRLLRGSRVMLIKGEAGEEFAEAFFNQKIVDLLQRVPNLTDDLAPKQLAKSMIEQNADLLVADVSTCQSLMAQAEIRERYRPLKEAKHTALLPSLKMGEQEYARLALYRIAFGLSRDDHEWKQMIDEAFECLMSEGIRSLLSLYREYVDRASAFRSFLIPDDDTVASQLVRSHFEGLIGNHGE